MKLTKRAIDALAYQGDGESRDVRWDEEVPGFGVRIYPTGKKAFVLSYRVQGRKRLLTLGRYGVLTVDQARDQARKHLVNIGGGADPVEMRRRAADGVTVMQLCRAYLDEYATIHKRTWRDDERRINKRIVPAWGSQKAVSIRHSDVAALHARIGANTPYEANRTVELLSKMFELAAKWGVVPDEHRNPAKGVEQFKEHKRDRWVTPEELPKLAAAIDQERNAYARYALWLYLLTGVRKNELLRAEWEHVDLARKELRLPETKSGRVHYVPLSEPAIALLRAIPVINTSPFVFPGTGVTGHLINIDKPWRRVRKVAGVEDVRLHDLRRTVGSWLAQSGNSLHLIGRVLNHSNASTTAVYARFAQDNVRQALDDHGRRLMAVAKGETAEVIPLPRKESGA